MKILLTHGYFLEEDMKEQNIMKPYPPLGILCISAFLEKNNYPNQIFDSTFASFEKLKQHFLSEQPDVVGIYTNLMTKTNVLRIIRFIRNSPDISHIKIVLGGPEVTHHAENFLKYGADFIVFGEGENSMFELVQYLNDRKINNLESITGIGYLENGKLRKNPPREKVRDINELPFPNRKLINLDLYINCWKEHHGQSTLNINTMRGCPYTCKWCSRAVYGQSYRRRSPSLVADEIEYLLENYSCDTFWFVDDVFTVSHQWLREFTEIVKTRGLQFQYECITRADRMNDQVINLLKESGCFRVWIGAESGSQKVIDLMDRRVKIDQVKEMIQLSRSYGLKAGTFIMLGYPGETGSDVRDTLLHLKESDPDEYTITVAYPIKGTPFYDEVEPNILNPLPWEETNDRENDFSRTYRRKYYDFAIRWIYNEMAAQKSESPVKKMYYKLKSSISLAGMKWNSMV